MTQCNNCRFRAKDEDGDISGRIRVSERGAVYLFVDGLGNKCFLADRMQKMGITDFEIVPRDPETYKDWQVGDKIIRIDDLSEREIIFRSGEFVVFKYCGDDDASTNFTCQRLLDTGYRLVLTDIEKRIIEEKDRKQKPYEFKKGEPVLVRDDNDSIWILGSFIQFIPNNCFHVTNGVRPSHWKQCLPYNEKTMHLLGTTEDYKEE